MADLKIYSIYCSILSASKYKMDEVTKMPTCFNRDCDFTGGFSSSNKKHPMCKKCRDHKSVFKIRQTIKDRAAKIRRALTIIERTELSEVDYQDLKNLLQTKTSWSTNGNKFIEKVINMWFQYCIYYFDIELNAPLIYTCLCIYILIRSSLWWHLMRLFNI